MTDYVQIILILSPLAFVAIAAIAWLGYLSGAAARWPSRAALTTLATFLALIGVPPPPCVNPSSPDCVDWPFWVFDFVLIFGLYTWINHLFPAKVRTQAPAVGPLTSATPTANAAPSQRHRTYPMGNRPKRRVVIQ